MTQDIVKQFGPCQALSDRDKFCELMARARMFKIPGYWDADAYQKHPCGFLVGPVLMTNYWHTFNSCSIQITDGTGWELSGLCHDSQASSASTHPKPIGGSDILVWADGSWINSEFESKLRLKISEILVNLGTEITWKEQEAAAKAYSDKQFAQGEKAHLEGVAIQNVLNWRNA